MKVLRTEKMPGRKRNRPLKDYGGERFGRLVAVCLVRRDDKGHHEWAFVCDCGTECVKDIKLVTQGKTSSCGCRAREVLVKRNTTHGLSRKHPKAYRTWKDMRARCNNPNSKDYRNYGGRGIKVCKRWGSFENFLEDMGLRPGGLTIDRIDVNGDYSPENCRWADIETQANNKRDTVWMDLDGRRVSFSQWCRAHGVERAKAMYRIKNGLPPLSKNDFRKWQP